MSSKFFKRAEDASADKNQLLHAGNASILERPSQRMHYWLRGPLNGPAVVLLHGTGMDRNIFAPQVEHLSKSYQVLVIDLMAHGLSTNTKRFSFADALADMQALFDTLQFDSVTLIGSSLGGYFAQWLAHLQPGRISGMLLMSCAPLHSRLPLFQRLKFRYALAAATYLPHWLVSLQAVPHLTTHNEHQTYIRDAIRQVAKPDFVAALAVQRDYPIESPQYRPAMPILIAHGSYNRVGWISDNVTVWQAISPSVRSVIVPGAGFCLPLDNPVFCNKMFSDFLYRDVSHGGDRTS